MECDFAIALPYKFRLQDNASIVEELQERNSRTLGNYSRRLQDYSRVKDRYGEPERGGVNGSR
jgi:hypothetical protein